MMSWWSAMEVMTMHNASNMHAMRVPSQPCDASVLHMHNDECMQIPIPCQAISISLSRSKRCQSGGWNQSTPPRSKGSPKRTTQRVAPREEKRRWVLVRLRLMGRGKDPHGWNLKRHGSGLPHGTWSSCLGGTKSPRCLGRTKQ